MKIILFFLLSLFFCSCTKSPPVEPYNAIKSLKDRITRAPSFENYSNLGLEYSNSSNRDEALKAFKMALQINPKAPLAWNNVCAELSSQGKFREAIPHCEKALELEPKFNLAKNNLAHAKSKLEK
jgi:tetratricopeptide (TPR) repeat protein